MAPVQTLTTEHPIMLVFPTFFMMKRALLYAMSRIGATADLHDARMVSFHQEVDSMVLLPHGLSAPVSEVAAFL